MGTISSAYSGYKIISVDDPCLPAIYEKKDENFFDLLENEYLMVQDHDGAMVDKFKWQDGKFKGILKKPIESVALGKIRAKNAGQELAIDALMDTSTTVKVLTSPAGGGKDVLMAACAFNMLQAGSYDKIIWIRNNVEVKNSNPIGFLPGTASEKIFWAASPLADHVGGKDALELYIQQGKVEIEHLGFLRGRDFKNAIILCSEAEHLTRQHVQLIISRIAENSIVMFNGDWRQIDAKVFETDNGLLAVIDRLKGNRLFSYVHMTECVRSETAKLADLLD